MRDESMIVPMGNGCQKSLLCSHFTQRNKSRGDSSKKGNLPFPLICFDRTGPNVSLCLAHHRLSVTEKNRQEMKIMCIWTPSLLPRNCSVLPLAPSYFG